MLYFSLLEVPGEVLVACQGPVGPELHGGVVAGQDQVPEGVGPALEAPGSPAVDPEHLAVGEGEAGEGVLDAVLLQPELCRVERGNITRRISPQ